MKIYLMCLKEPEKPDWWWFVPYKASNMAAWAHDFINGHERYMNYVKEGYTILDIGATTGEYAIPAAEKAGPTGTVYAFEPEPLSFACLLRNMWLCHADNVVAIKRALSDKCETIPLYFAEDTIAGASMSPDEDRPEEVEVEATTLDDFVTKCDIEKIDILKITVNGHERSVIKGGIETMQGKVKYVVVQTFPRETGETLRLLEAMDYKLVHGAKLINIDPDTDEKNLTATTFLMRWLP